LLLTNKYLLIKFVEMGKPIYIIIQGDDTNQLQYLVNEKIKESYFPIGGILREKRYTGNEKYYVYFQAMLFSEYDYAMRQTK